MGKIPFPFCGEVIVEGLGFLVERQLKEKADAVIQERRDGEWSRLWPGRRLQTTQLHWAGRGSICMFVWEEYFHSLLELTVFSFMLSHWILLN